MYTKEQKEGFLSIGDSMVDDICRYIDTKYQRELEKEGYVLTINMVTPAGDVITVAPQQEPPLKLIGCLHLASNSLAEAAKKITLSAICRATGKSESELKKLSNDFN